MQDPSFYKAFEDQHRGSPSSVRRRLLFYVPLLKVLQSQLEMPSCLDLGCGRGEWMTLMSEFNLACRGVDNDPVMVDWCQQQGIDATCDDALLALRASADNSLGLISAFHMIEHMPFDRAQTLFSEAMRTLKPGGVLLFETPNPENPLVGSCYFYTDPSHHKPVPPGLLLFSAQHAGFDLARICRLNETAPSSHQHTPHFYEVLSGSSPDYALIAVKPGNPDMVKALTPWLNTHHGLTLETLADRYQQAIDDDRTAHKALALQVDELHATVEQLRMNTRWAQAISWRMRHVISAIKERRPMPLGRSSDVVRQFITGVLRRLGLLEYARRHYYRLGGGKRRWQSRPLPAHHGYDLPETGPLDPVPAWPLVRQLSVPQPAHFPVTRPTGLPALIIDGHFSGSYSLATTNRLLAVALHAAAPDMPLKIAPRETLPTRQISDVSDGSLPTLLTLRDAHINTQTALVLLHHYPVVTDVPKGARTILLFFWEESLVPADTIAIINNHYESVLVTTWLVKKALQDSGCLRPIYVVPVPINPPERLTALPAEGPIRLLHVSSCFPRKGVDILLRSFNALCEQGAVNVELVIKTFPNPHNTVTEQVKRLVAAPFRDSVQVIMDDYTTDAMHDLYRSCHAVVLPSRGEGLNMPALEAMLHERPLITTGHGAQTDFLATTGARLVNYRFALSHSHVNSARSLWVEPDAHDLTRQMRILVSDLSSGKALPLRADAEHVRQRFCNPPTHWQLLERLKHIFHNPSMATCHFNSLVMVTTWEQHCGIAEYSRFLLEALAADRDDVSVWAPYIDAGSANIMSWNNALPTERCWKQGATFSATLCRRLSHTRQPIWLQHHPAFFPLDAALTKAISFAVQQGLPRFITLHSTRLVAQLPEAQRAQAADSLNAFSRVVVHSIDDMNILKSIGVADNTLLLPHGISNYGALHTLKRDTFTVACFGFLFEHKGVVDLIDGFAAWRLSHLPEQEDARLVLLNSLHTSPASAAYAKQCRSRIAHHGLEDTVTFTTSFLDTEEIIGELSQADVVMMPYKETPESASGAVRIALAANECVAVTPARIFDEVRSLTVDIKGFSADDIATTLDRVFNDRTSALGERPELRQEWLKEHDWSSIAALHNGIISAIEVDGFYCREQR